MDKLTLLDQVALQLFTHSLENITIISENEVDTKILWSYEHAKKFLAEKKRRDDASKI